MGNDKSKPKGGGGGAPAAKQPVVSQTVAQTATLKQTISRLEQRRDFLDKKQDAEHKLAIAKNKKGDKKGALAHLKRKKMYAKEIEKINGAVINLEQQTMAIESTSVTADIVKAMETGKNALNTITQSVDVDKIENLQDDIREQMQQSEEIDQVLGAPIGMDDMDLEDELAELEADGIEEELDALPSVPAAAKPAATAAESLPAVPSHAVADDDDALAALEAEMAA